MSTATAFEPTVTLAPITDDGMLYEIIDGQRVEMPPMTAYATWLAFQLASARPPVCQDEQPGSGGGGDAFSPGPSR